MPHKYRLNHLIDRFILKQIKILLTDICKVVAVLDIDQEIFCIQSYQHQIAKINLFYFAITKTC